MRACKCGHANGHRRPGRQPLALRLISLRLKSSPACHPAPLEPHLQAQLMGFGTTTNDILIGGNGESACRRGWGVPPVSGRAASPSTSIPQVAARCQQRQGQVPGDWSWWLAPREETWATLVRQDLPPLAPPVHGGLDATHYRILPWVACTSDLPCIPPPTDRGFRRCGGDWHSRRRRQWRVPQQR